MRVVCNGSPKTGTHALHRVVSLFYDHIDLPLHDHVEYRQKDASSKYIHITRHPKNTLISWVRFDGYEVTENNLLQEMRHIIDEMSLYTAWLRDSSVLNVRFESLFTEDTLRKIAAFIRRSPIENHLSKAWGGSRTFTGRHSNYNEHWTPILEKHWLQLDGDRLERELGYAN